MMQRWRSQFCFGFSLIEALIVIAAMALLTTVSVVGFQNFNRHEALGKDAAKVVAVYEEARALSLGSKNASVYGVHAETSRVVRFKGSSYVAGNADNESEPLNSLVWISSISLSGGAVDTVFSRLGGTTTASGTLTLALRADPLQTKTITIYATGLVDITD